MAVLTRARAQQAEESGERPIAPEPQEMTCQQRKKYNNSGIDAKRAMIRAQQDPQVEGPRPVRHQKSNFKSPTDFYAGPAEAGRVLGGPRRYDDRNTDTVGFMLSDDFHSSTGVRPPVKPVGGPQHVDNRCLPLQNEPVPRLLVKPIHENEGLDCPFEEHLNPRPPRDVEKPRSVKVFPDKYSTTTTVCFAPPPQYPQPAHGNRSNESKQMTDYFASKDVEGPKKPNRIIGPVKWTAPEMDYPKRRAAIRTINSECTACHDVLGNGRFGNVNTVNRKGLAAVESPYKDQDPLIAFVEPVKEEPRPVKPNTITRYFDPSFDDPSQFKNKQKAVGKSHPPGRAMNCVSKDSNAPPRGKARGQFAQGNSREFVIG